jgi:hypothetical protein
VSLIGLLVRLLECLYVWVFICLLMFVLVYIQVFLSHGYIRKNYFLAHNLRKIISYQFHLESIEFRGFGSTMSAHIGGCSILCLLVRMFVLVYV